MSRKARAGHVCGGRTFAYDNLEVLDASGQRSHVERSINEGEAAVVRRIFQMSAAGAGLTRITKALNEDDVPAPRPQQGRPVGWAPSTVRSMLLREQYHGVIAWNQSRKRDRWGRCHWGDILTGEPPECPADRTAASRLAIDLTVLIPPRSDGSENEKLTAQAGL
jgi:hypothetical protein